MSWIQLNGVILGCTRLSSNSAKSRSAVRSVGEPAFAERRAALLAKSIDGVRQEVRVNGRGNYVQVAGCEKVGDFQPQDRTLKRNPQNDSDPGLTAPDD